MKTYEQMAADVLRRRDESQAKRKRTTRMVATAAVVCLVTVGVTVGIWGGVTLSRRDNPNQTENTTNIPPLIPQETHPDGVFWVDNRERLDISFTTPEVAIEWGWEDMTDGERYTNLEFDGETYHMRGTVSNYLGEWLESGEVYGFAWDQDNARHGIPCEIYALTFSPDHSVVAVQFEGTSKFYRFECEREYDPPKTIGEFIETRKLAEVLPLTTLYYSDGGLEETRYSLSAESSDEVWRILVECDDAPFAKGYKYYHNKEDVSFSATSEVLGIRNLSFTINEEGYIITNIEQYGYYYNIGVEAAREVIDYVKAHMTEPQPVEKPSVYRIVGTVTEIGSGYIKVDDSIIMKNPEDGLIFTVVTQDKRLSRVVNLLRVGSQIMVVYDGFVSKEDPTRIEYASAIHSVWITEDGDVLIPE